MSSFATIADQLKSIADGKLPANPFEPGAPNFPLPDDKLDYADIAAKIADIMKAVKSRQIAGSIDPPRMAIETCQGLARKLASLRDEHRSLQSAMIARSDTLEDLQDELAFKSRSSLNEQLERRSKLADSHVNSVKDVKKWVDSIRTRITNQLNGIYTDGRIDVIARAEADLAESGSLPPAGQPGRPAQEPLEVAVDVSEAPDGTIGWSRNLKLKPDNSYHHRIQILTAALGRLNLIKERIGARLAFEDAEIRKLEQELSILEAEADRAEFKLFREGHDHDKAVLKRSIDRLTTREGAFYNNFRDRIALVLRRYVVAAEALGAASARLARSCEAHDLGEAPVFDPKVIVDPADSGDDDAAIQTFIDLVDAIEQAWNDRIGGAVGGLLPLGRYKLVKDGAEPTKLSVTFPWTAPMLNCFAEGLLIAGPVRETVTFAIEIPIVVEDLNKAGMVVKTTTSAKFYSFPVETWDGKGDRETAVVRGGFLANLAGERKIRLTAQASGRDGLDLDLYVEAFGLPKT